LILTSAGSHTKVSKVFVTPSFLMSTPAQISFCACFWRSLFRMSVESKPALSQSWRGITSRALAKAEIRSCCLPGMVLAYSRRCLNRRRKERGHVEVKEGKGKEEKWGGGGERERERERERE